MITVSYNGEHNTIIIEFEGAVDAVQAEQSFRDVEQVLSQCSPGFRVLTDLSSLKTMDIDVKGAVEKTTELLKARGVMEILRVIPDPAVDIGFNILSIFHYPREVTVLTLPSREEAQARWTVS